VKALDHPLPLPATVVRDAAAGQHDLALVQRCGLHHGDLVLTEAFADQVQTGGKRGIAKDPLAAAGRNACRQRLLGVRQFGLGLGKRGCDGANRLT